MTPRAFLTLEEEQALAHRWRDLGDVKARDRIVLAHEPVARGFVAKVRRSTIPREDLMQTAFVGLLEAAKRFDPTKGFRFSTFAKYWVRAMVLDHMLHNTQIVRGPSHAEGRRRFFSGQRYVVLDLNAPLGGDMPDVTIADTIPAESIDVDALIDEEKRAALLSRHLARLNDRESRIIKDRHLRDPDDCATLDDLGTIFGVSKERIRQIETGAIRKLTRALTGGRTATPGSPKAKAAA